MSSENKAVELAIAPEELEKLRLHAGTVAQIKGVIQNGKLTVIGVQQEFSSAYGHNWPSNPAVTAYSHQWPGGGVSDK
jgi:hypothetical protein